MTADQSQPPQPYRAKKPLSAGASSGGAQLGRPCDPTLPDPQPPAPPSAPDAGTYGPHQLVVTDMMQGVDCYWCEDEMPHIHRPGADAGTFETALAQHARDNAMLRWTPPPDVSFRAGWDAAQRQHAAALTELQAQADREKREWADDGYERGYGMATEELSEQHAAALAERDDEIRRLREALENLERKGRLVGSWAMTAPQVDIAAFAAALNEARAALAAAPPAEPSADADAPGREA